MKTGAQGCSTDDDQFLIRCISLRILQLPCHRIDEVLRDCEVNDIHPAHDNLSRRCNRIPGFIPASVLVIDRVDHEVAHLYDPLHPAVLFLLSSVISMARKAEIPVAVCGEMAGDVKWTRLLLGMGLLEFSMHPSQLLSVKQEILNSDLSLLEPQVKKVLRSTEPSAIEAAMAQLRSLVSEPEVKAIRRR